MFIANTYNNYKVTLFERSLYTSKFRMIYEYLRNYYTSMAIVFSNVRSKARL